MNERIRIQMQTERTSGATEPGRVRRGYVWAQALITVLGRRSVVVKVGKERRYSAEPDRWSVLVPTPQGVLEVKGTLDCTDFESRVFGQQPG
jgi:hypothetical protein